MTATKTTAAKSVTLIVGQAAIVKAIESIQTRGKRLDDDIQLAGLSVLAHIEEHGDVTLANRLYLALPRGARAVAMTAWFVKFGKLMPNLDRKTAKEMPFAYDKNGKTDLAEATKLPWFDMKPSPEVADFFDMSAEVAKLLKKVQSYQEKNPNAEVRGADLIAKLQALSA